MTYNGLIFDIKRFAVHDGPGIRTTVFMKGCPLRCWWCHNPEGISPKNELMFFEYKCMRCRTCAGVCPAGAIFFENEGGFPKIERNLCIGCGICADACPTNAMRLVGRVINVEELIIKELERDVLFYDKSGGGVTFSGGEPLAQPHFLKEALKRCKEHGFHTALDTSGFAPRDTFEEVMDYVDFFLFDLKLAKEEHHKKYTGVSNEPIRENLRLLDDAGKGKDVLLRLPVIPGITDTNENIEGLVEFASSLKDIRQIELLPFHDVSEKYARLSREYKMVYFSAPPPATMKRIKEAFERIGFNVKI